MSKSTESIEQIPTTIASDQLDGISGGEMCIVDPNPVPQVTPSSTVSAQPTARGSVNFTGTHQITLPDGSPAFVH
jgi:hypothetical protein